MFCFQADGWVGRDLILCLLFLNCLLLKIILLPEQYIWGWYTLNSFTVMQQTLHLEHLHLKHHWCFQFWWPLLNDWVPFKKMFKFLDTPYPDPASLLLGMLVVRVYLISNSVAGLVCSWGRHQWDMTCPIWTFEWNVDTVVGICSPAKRHSPWCSMFCSLFTVLVFKFDPTGLGRIDAKGQVVLALERENMIELNEILDSFRLTSCR